MPQPTPLPDWDPAARTGELAHRMVGWQSETGTDGEAEFGPRLADLLREIPYFRDNPGNVLLLDSHGTPARQNVVAIVRGAGPQAVALAGHYDTASIANYQQFAPLACLPGPLAQALIDDLSGRVLSAQETRALHDLRSGAFIPGRAMLDMKSGLAAGTAVLERFAQTPDAPGSLIFIATPDEERESRGMRSLRDRLPALMRDRGLTIVAGLNLDATSDQGDGDRGRAVYAGTIGKLLPFALVVGQSSHASYPFEGISAQLIGAEILRGIEGNPDLADRNAAEIVPPPICLEARDLRDGYEVTTPDRFWLSFNWLYQSGSADDLFAQFRAEVEAASARATAAFSARAAEFAALAGHLGPAAPAAARVLTLSDLRALALAETPGAQTTLMALEADLAALDNPLDLTRRLTIRMLEMARIAAPAVIVGFAGLHYPPSSLNGDRPADAALRTAVDVAVSRCGHDPASRVRWRPIFYGISDMSFFGQTAGGGGSALVAANTAAHRLGDVPPPDALRFPVVNIGPWGREFHQKLERLHAPYAFGILPRVLAECVEALLRP